MSFKKEILKGTLILTIAGIITRILGLYNRVFLANLISASELGLYQLIFPVLSVCSAICCYGIESALSKIVAAQSAGRCYQNVQRTVKVAVGMALGLSIGLFMAVYIFSEPIAIYFLQEPACAPYLKIMALVLPFSTLHSCTLGYFLGMQKTAVPASSQLIEQVVRVTTIWVLSTTFYALGNADASMAVYGMLAGEVVSCIFTVAAYKISAFADRRRYEKLNLCERPDSYRKIFSNFWAYAYPLTVNRLLLTVLSSFESVLIPMMLKLFYKSSETALEIFGVATGMAFPFIMFPTTITNSLATMLLPAVSKANEEKDYPAIRRAISKSVHYCLLIGILSMTVFFIYGNMLGMVIFKNELAGQLLKIFAFLCPFMYISSALSSTLNGLGMVKTTLIHSTISLFVRICFLVLIVPKRGIEGYLWGQLAGYLILVALNGRKVVKNAGLSLNPWKTLVFPMAFAALSALFSLAVYQFMLHYISLPPVIMLLISCAVLCMLYIGCLIYTKIIEK